MPVNKYKRITFERVPYVQLLTVETHLELTKELYEEEKALAARYFNFAKLDECLHWFLTFNGRFGVALGVDGIRAIMMNFKVTLTDTPTLQQEAWNMIEYHERDATGTGEEYSQFEDELHVDLAGAEY